MSRPRYPFRQAACVPFCLAEALERPGLAHSLPTATTDGWLPRLNEQLLAQAGHWLSPIPAGALPFDHPELEWLAGVRAADGTPHAVLALRGFVTFDPNGELAPGDPLPAVEEGWVILSWPHEAIEQARMERLADLERTGAVTIGSET